MKALFIILSAAFSIQSQALTPWGQRGLFHESDSGVRGPAYEAIVAQMQDLAKEHANLVDFVTYGQSVQGQPLTAIRLSLKSRRATGMRNAVLMTGATHGDEFLGFEHEIGRYFVQNVDRLPQLRAFLAAGGLVYIVPVVNPDGYRARERHNARGTDLNRDFPLRTAQHPGFQQPETASLGRYVDNEVRSLGGALRVSIDYHCCFGAMLYPWSFSRPAPPPVPAGDEQAFLAIGTLMKTHFGANYEIGKTPSLLGYDALGSTKDYYYENYKTLSFTFEGVYGGREKLENHVAFWESIFGGINRAASPERFIRR